MAEDPTLVDVPEAPLCPRCHRPGVPVFDGLGNVSRAPQGNDPFARGLLRFGRGHAGGEPTWSCPAKHRWTYGDRRLWDGAVAAAYVGVPLRYDGADWSRPVPRVARAAGAVVLVGAGFVLLLVLLTSCVP